jgi:tetratricopeptide (TPR) repeat protein
MRKTISIIILIVGLALIITGVIVRIPGDNLTTYSYLDGIDNYSSIKEYVGGDAYNYIIGAALVGGKIAGTIAMKAIFISCGCIIVCIGLTLIGKIATISPKDYNESNNKNTYEKNTDNNASTHECDENARLTDIYNRAVFAMHGAKTESEYRAVAETFKMVSGFKNADPLAEQCIKKAEVCRKDDIYASALSQMNKNVSSGYEAAINAFRTISDWKDADEQIYACQQKIEEIKAKEETARIERERKSEQRRIAAKNIKKIAAIVTPIVVVCVAFVIVLITVIIPNNKYNAAVDLYNAGKYEEAITAFSSLNGYKDSESQITNCETSIKDKKYNYAVDLYNAGKYEEAITAFSSLNGYKDSAIKAYEIYESDSFKDKVEKDKVEKLKTAKVGDCIIFGSYEQDNNTLNGNEDIEWIVLAKEDDKLLVISTYALDCQPYNTSYTDVTWETCSLRKWLNDTFINSAFNSIEQGVIYSTNVAAHKNPSYTTSPGNNTIDQMFLLSITEAEQYLETSKKRQCKGTAYCYAQGARTVKGWQNPIHGNCLWWLRSSGVNSGDAVYVYFNGNVRNDGDKVNSAVVGIRPAMWINLGS